MINIIWEIIKSILYYLFVGYLVYLTIAFIYVFIKNIVGLFKTKVEK